VLASGNARRQSRSQMSKYRIAWMPGDGVGHDVRPGRRTRLRSQRKHRRQLCRIRTDAWIGAEIRRPIQGESDRNAFDHEADSRLAQRNRARQSSRFSHCARHRGRQSPHLRKTCPVPAATRTRRGEGGKDSTLDVAKAIADYADS
jgi:hypothetical protein